MRRLTRSLAAATFLAFQVAVTTPAIAGGFAHTDCDGDGCDTSATSTREATRLGKGKRNSSQMTCRYHNLDIAPDAPFFRPDGSRMEADGTGRWIERVCIDARDLVEIDDHYPGASDLFTSTARITDIARAIQRRPLYVRPRAAPALVEEARSRLAFPLLRPRFTPAAPWTFVYLPTALWLDGEALQPRTATAEVPGVRVTVTAEPEEIHWSTGDGAVVVCRAPGRPPNPAVPGDRGDCTHIWSWPSAGRAANSYEVTATVFWHVTWTAEGAPGGGDLGIVPQRSDVLRVPVAEIQVLNAPPTP